MGNQCCSKPSPKEGLRFNDWKLVQQCSPDSVKSLDTWITKFGELNTHKLTGLADKIVEKTKNKICTRLTCTPSHLYPSHLYPSHLYLSHLYLSQLCHSEAV